MCKFAARWLVVPKLGSIGLDLWQQKCKNSYFPYFVEVASLLKYVPNVPGDIDESPDHTLPRLNQDTKDAL